MRADRTRPARSNRRLRRMEQDFAGALQAKERRARRDEAFAAELAPGYDRYGQDVAAADRTRRIREADRVAFQNTEAEVAIVDGRIVIESRR